MIAVDTNLLIYAHRLESVHHEAAYRSLAILCEAPEAWAIPWPCIHEFIAVVTNRRTFARPSTVEEAFQQIDSWVDSPGLVLLEETENHWPVLSRTIHACRATGGLVHDARIAAICIEHGVRELWTCDRDFSRFPELATFNPLIDEAVHETRPAYGAAVRARAAGRRRSLSADAR